MRSFIAAILLFSIIIIGIAINSAYVRTVTDKLSRIAKELQDDPSNIKLSDEISSLWKKNMTALSLSVKEDRLERMNDLVEELHADQDAGSAHEIKRLCILIRVLCEEISKHERLSLEGIL